jgi:hypothetical protein
MLKQILIFILKKSLKFTKTFNILTPFVFLFSFFSGFKTLKIIWSSLKKNSKFLKVLTKVMRISSFISLFINLFLVILLNNIDIISFIPSVPAINSFLIYSFNLLPDSIIGWFTNIWNYIKYVFKFIWKYIVQFLKYIFNSILDIFRDPVEGDEEINPNPNPGHKLDPKDDPKFKESYNKWFREYNYYIYGGAIILLTVLGIYIFWDKIPNPFNRGEGDDGNLPGNISSPNTSDPSSGRSINEYPDGYLKHFSRKMGDMVEEVKGKAKELYNKSISKPPIDPNFIPKGIYKENGQTMWNGLPLPRVESLDNGQEFYITKDENNFIRILSNSINSTDMVDIVDPIKNISIGR